MIEPVTAVQPAKGKLGVLIVGMNGAVATTFMGGVSAVRKGIAKPIGSLTQLGTIRLGKRTENRSPLIREFVSLTNLKDIVFGGWDIRNETAQDGAARANVLNENHLKAIRRDLEELHPMRGVFDQYYVKRLTGQYVKKGKNKLDLAEQVRDDIRSFKKRSKVDRLVMLWCGSTEIYITPTATHQSLKRFEDGLKKNSIDISPSMIYAYAALMEGVPHANGAPHLCTDIPALTELAIDRNVPIMGKDFKTGQTLMKTVIAPMLKTRMLGLKGWFSSNILGNLDGEVLDDPESFRSKEVSKLGVLEYILQPDLYPDLYKDYYHKVRINYYPPSGDNKEGWDNIDIFGWLGYPMQIKVDFLCRDSILAAPIALDIVLFLDLAQRSGMRGIQEWMSFYFKTPMHAPGIYPEHDLFIQTMKLKNRLRHLMGEELITHLGLEYYE